MTEVEEKRVAKRRRRETEYCPGCSENRPVEEFLGLEVKYDPMDVPILCRRCREVGPPKKDTFGALTVAQRTALQALAEGANMADAARAAGFSPKTLRKFMDGKAVPAFRRAFQMMLEESGLDSTTIIRTYQHTLRATRYQWNRKTEQFEAFPDYNVRLKTAQQLAKHHELEYPKESAGSGGTPVQVVINTNLDSAPPAPGAGQAMRAVATRVSPNGRTLHVERKGSTGECAGRD